MPTVLRSMLLFAVAAVAEIGGAWLIWQGVREHRGVAFVGAGIVALAAYGFVATAQPDANFGGSWLRTAASSSQARWRGARRRWVQAGPVRSSRVGDLPCERGGDHVGAALKNLLTFKYTRRFTLGE